MARRALGKKPQSPIVPVAQALKKLGYDPIPLRSGKGTPPKGWPKIPNGEKDIAGWRGHTVAVRMQRSPDLFGADLDIQRQDVLDEIIRRYQERWPDFMARCVIRHSGGVKVMLIGRLSTDKRHMYSNRYGVTEEHKGGNRVELFTSNDARYIAVWGRHSPPDREYGYDGPQLHEVALQDLPEFLDADLNELLAIANEVMEGLGLAMVERGGVDKGDVAFDLVADMMAELEDGRHITLEELEEEASDKFVYVHGRIFDPGSDHFRVKAKVTSQGLTLWDFGTDTVHYWRHLGPQMDVLGPQLAALAAAAGGSMFGQAKALPEGVTIEDFRAFMPRHDYIFMPLGDHWPVASINSVLPIVRVARADGTVVPLKPSTWLDQNRSVEQALWAPGLPQVIEGRLLSEGGWVERPRTAAFNRYRGPTIKPGDGSRAGRWIDLLNTVYPDDAEHITCYFAHRIQRPQEKINHGLVLVGTPGIGKDTLIEPLKYGVGPWNFREISPHDVMEKWNDYMRAVVIRVSEARDLGEDSSRYALHEKMKTMLAAPPDVLRIEAKYTPQYYVLNVAGVIITTNHQHDGLYLPPNDRRHYVAGTEVTAADFEKGYWTELWNWYRNGGIEDVVSYLAGYDLVAAGFDPKAEPFKTEAFWRMVGTAVAPEVAELNDAISELKNPEAVTLWQLQQKAGRELQEWLRDRRNRRAIPHRMESCGYLPVRNTLRADGWWVISEKRQAVYARMELAPQARFDAARALVETLKQQAEEAMKKLNEMKKGSS